MSPPTAESLNTRLQAVEKATGETLLEIQHRQKSQGEAITELRNDMHRLVDLNERQLLLQQSQAESSKALDRAFTSIKELRVDTAASSDAIRRDTNDLIRQMGLDWAKWRDSHEAENSHTSDFAKQARGGLRVLGVLGLVLWGILGAIAWDWRADLQGDIKEETAARLRYENAVNVRLDAHTSAIQENRMDIKTKENREAPHP